MNTKQQVASLLEQGGEGYLSGAAIARSLGLTRSAVWKCIRQLEAEGYAVEASSRGYRLRAESDAVSEGSIRKYLGPYTEHYSLEVLSDVDSTNNYLKVHAPELPAWHAVLAGSQSAGRGRLGRRFISPAGSGIYLSVLLRPQLTAGQAVRITTAAAVAACRAIEACLGESPQIKWVNDVYLRGKKTCGILTEASIDLESGGLDWVIMGIGFNVYEPDGGFPADIKDIAGPIAAERCRDLRSRLAAAFLCRFYDICTDLNAAGIAEEYRRRSMLIGKQINVIRGGSARPATALDIDGECRLLVRYEDGTEEALSSGEVSVRAAHA